MNEKWDIFTYFSDPHERFRAQLDTVEAEESNCAFSWNSKHEKFVVESHLHVANIVIGVETTFFAEVNLSQIFLFSKIDTEFFTTSGHEVGLIIFDIGECDQLADRLVCLHCLVRRIQKFTIADFVGVHSTSVGSNHNHVRISTEAS